MEDGDGEYPSLATLVECLESCSEYRTEFYTVQSNV
jgi:hypothetical protein